jgi:hypothetical protein
MKNFDKDSYQVIFEQLEHLFNKLSFALGIYLMENKWSDGVGRLAVPLDALMSYALGTI